MKDSNNVRKLIGKVSTWSMQQKYEKKIAELKFNEIMFNSSAVHYQNFYRILINKKGNNHRGTVQKGYFFGTLSKVISFISKEG